MKNLFSKFTLACLFILFSLSLVSVVKAEEEVTINNLEFSAGDGNDVVLHSITITPEGVTNSTSTENVTLETNEETQTNSETLEDSNLIIGNGENQTIVLPAEIGGQNNTTTSTTFEITENTFGTASSTDNIATLNYELITEEAIEPRLLSSAELEEAAEKILNYIESQIDEEGKVLEGGTTDWVTMSFGANGDYIDELENGKAMLEYLKTYPFNGDTDRNVCATYPRNILALLAAGLDPEKEILSELLTTFQADCLQEDYYGRIVNEKGEPVGDEGINDDIFALFASIELGSTTGTEIMVERIVANQSESGAFNWNWGDVPDATGGAINALVYAKNNGMTVDQTIIDNAKNYLKESQLEDGGWGWGPSDAFNTSWVIMGINALNETQEDWVNESGNNPWNVLVDNLDEEGYYKYETGSIDWFTTKHVVPALLGKTWPIVLEPKSVPDGSDLVGEDSNNKPETVTPPSSGSSGGYSVHRRLPTTDEQQTIEGKQLEQLEQETKTTTSTPELIVLETPTSTSTLEIVTSTIEVVEEVKMIEQLKQVEKLDNQTTRQPAYQPTTYYPIPTNEVVIKDVASDKISAQGGLDSIGEKSDENEKNEQVQQLEQVEQQEKGDMSSMEKLFYTMMTAGGALSIYLIWKLVKSLI